MNKTIPIKLLSEVGVLIFFSSLFLPWFSCVGMTVGYTDPLNHYYKIHLYLSCFAFVVYLFTKLPLKSASLSLSFAALLLTSVLLFMLLLLLLWVMTEIGFHQTVDIPCPSKPGFWLNVLGSVLFFVGIAFRTVNHALK